MIFGPQDKDVRANWIKRHSQIKDKNGVHVMTKKTSSSLQNFMGM